MNHNEILKLGGEIVDVTDGSVEVDIEGRLANIKVPKRMVICEDDLKIGQKISLQMSYINVITEEKNHINKLNEF